MYRAIVLSWLIGGFLVGVRGTEARAQLPEDRIIEFSIHETPNDPDSEIVFVVQLELTAEDSEGDSVGWEILEAVFRQPDPGSGPDTVWTEDAPVVDSPDGLWWIDHANASDPQLSEFLLPPQLTGTADAEDPQDDDLDYDIVGEEYTAPKPPGSPPYDPTGSLTYSFALALEDAPFLEGTDDPVEPDGGTGDPG